LLQNPAEGLKMTERGRSIYQRTCSVEASVERLMTLYDDALRISRQCKHQSELTPFT
jgi:hypothetical protein